MMIIAFSKICQMQMYRLFFLFNNTVFFLGGEWCCNRLLGIFQVSQSIIVVLFNDNYNIETFEANFKN